MRICVFNWKDPGHPAAGGAEVYTHEITARWAVQGHDVTWFTSAHPGAAAQSRTAEGVRVVRRGGRLSVYRAARDWYAAEGRGRFDVLVDEVNTRPFGCVAWAAGTPVVALVHQVAREVWFAETPWPVAVVGRFVLEPRWLRAYRETPVLTVSQSSRASLEEYGLRRVNVVPEGVRNRARPSVPRENRPTLVSVGRLCAGKRVGHTLAAFARLRVSLPDAQLWVVGDGPEMRRLRRVAPPGTVFHGRVERGERDELLARAHVMTATAVREGWALTVDEAAAMGTPTIAYDRPGLRDSVPAARGVLTAPSPRALAAGLARHVPGWFERPAAAGWVGGAVSWDVVAERVLEALAAVVAGAPVSVLRRKCGEGEGGGPPAPDLIRSENNPWPASRSSSRPSTRPAPSKPA